MSDFVAIDAEKGKKIHRQNSMEIIPKLIMVGGLLDDQRLMQLLRHFFPLLVEVRYAVDLKLHDHLSKGGDTSSEALGWE